MNRSTKKSKSLKKEKITERSPITSVFFKNITDSLPQYVFWKDKNSVYSGCNKNYAQLLGLDSPEDIVGKTDKDLNWQPSGHTTETFRQGDQDALANKPIINQEEILALPNGKKLVTLVSKLPIMDEGKPVGIVGYFTDITELKKLEEELREARNVAEKANHAKSEFIANMSHDIRTPLVGILGMAKMLENNATDPGQKQSARWLEESGNQLLTMLNEILDLIAADDTRETDLHQSSFNLRQVVENIVQLEKPSTKIKGLDLISSIDEEIPACLISDPTKIHRILLNLLGNAIKFTETGKVEIIVRLLKKTQRHVHLHFRVTDTGIGISENAKSNVFERFYRATPSYQGTYKGHGIGLHIAQTYVTLLGGTIQIDSKPGAGTSFYFDLSLPHGDRERQTPVFEKSPASHCDSRVLNTESVIRTVNNKDVSPGAPQVLLIEDDPIARITLENLVSQAGWRFASAEDGESGLYLAKKQSFDLIITDLGLPGISGTEFTKIFREIEQKNGRTPVPIVGLTAHAQDSVKKECLESGMNAVYTKPMRPDILEKIGQIWQGKNNFLTFEGLSAPKSANGWGKTGPDLPDTAEELFQLNTLAIFDSSSALPITGNDIKLFRNILQSMLEESTPKDILELEQAHRKNDWERIEKLAHRMRGGLVYCGTPRWACACQYMEAYHRAGHRELLEPLYQQLRTVTDETTTAIRTWLNNNSVL